MDDDQALALLCEVDSQSALVNPAGVNLPEPWSAVFSGHRSTRKDRALDLWSRCAGPLERFRAAQRRELQGVRLVQLHGCLQVAYSYGEQDIFVGGLPVGAEGTLGKLEQGPPALRRFYRELHDGYVFPWSRSLGPLARSDVFTLADEEWGWLDESGNRSGYEPLASKLVILGNGGGGYLCADVATPQTDDTQGLIWWKDGPPEVGGLLAVLDAWMEIGLCKE